MGKPVEFWDFWVQYPLCPLDPGAIEIADRPDLERPGNLPSGSITIGSSTGFDLVPSDSKKLELHRL